MDENEKASLKKLTAEIIEAGMDRILSERTDSYEETLTSDMWAEHQKFRDEVLRSERLQAEIIGIAAAIRSDKFTSENLPTLEEAFGMYKAGELTEWHIELVVSACREWFFYGWHGRGALDESGSLEWILNRRDRRKR